MAADNVTSDLEATREERKFLIVLCLCRVFNGGNARIGIRVHKDTFEPVELIAPPRISGLYKKEGRFSRGICAYRFYKRCLFE